MKNAERALTALKGASDPDRPLPVAVLEVSGVVGSASRGDDAEKGGVFVPEPIQQCDVEIRVRYAETDAMGYLHHANYLVYFEIGRTELLRKNGVRYADLEARGMYYVVAKLDCRYRAPARYDDLLTLTTRTDRLTRFRVDHSYELRRDGALLTEGRSTLVLVGADGRPTALPDDVYDELTGAATPAETEIEALDGRGRPAAALKGETR